MKAPRRWLPALLAALAPLPAHASLFSGETLDAVANGISWVVIFVTPVAGIALFWFLHILPEKVAEKRHHPQLDAIKTLCFLSLFFGGLLWPLAWLWAYSKPTFYKMAYGVDRVAPTHGAKATPVMEAEAALPAQPVPAAPAAGPAPAERGEPH